jgi:copper ion binding protein
MEQVTLKVKGMTCLFCASKIKKSVSKLTGVDVVKVNLLAANTEVSYDPSRLELEQIKDAINSLGYEVVG